MLDARLGAEAAMNDEHLIPLLERYAANRDPALRDELFERYLPLARAVARKFSEEIETIYDNKKYRKYDNL